MDAVIGVAIGVITGLLPGFHINNIIQSGFFNSPDLIIPSSIAFVFSSFVPMLLLGVPSSENTVILLPTHSMVKKGKAFTAAVISFYSSFISILLSFPLLLFMLLFKQVFLLIMKAIPLVLLLVLAKLFLSSKKTLLIALLSSLLGFITYKQETLLPLLSGFFALSSILLSEKSKALQSYFFRIKNHGEIVRSAFAGSFLGMFFSLIPAVSSSITASIGRVLGEMSDEEFVAFSSSVNMTYMIFSFYAFLLFGKMRSGSAVALSALNNSSLLYSASLVLFSASLTLFIMLFVTRALLPLYSKINKHALVFSSLALITASVFFFTGPYGLLVLLASTAIGITAIKLRVPRITCMTALILPTLVLLTS